MNRFIQLVLASFVLLHPGSVLAKTNPALLALNEGRADDAIHLLQSQLASSPRDAAAHLLLCRVYFAVEMLNPAIHECQAAVANAPGASDNYLWLGRAYGMKASQANPILAFTLARKVVAAFEKSVELDPANLAALRDLGEYYVNAPAIVGGGLDKARALSTKMMLVSPAKAHRLLGQIAQKDGDYPTAEAEFKHAVDAQRTADSNVDLAQFYLDRKLFDQTLAPIQAAARLDSPRDASAVDAASILIEEDRSFKLAEQLLREYLASPAKSDAAPAFKVHLQLGELLLKNSDSSGAKEQFDAALALASEYKPALRLDPQEPRHAGSLAVATKAIP